ncbi:uncharacterized protein N7483_007932 [Penicillium malachiteum]|uniref:uncharacterized protein n=1 Tax=Penicillium malachiteum TaxID=1324776 RepID=UPI002547B5F5|nr:uncharacterized protein N7483_007932 [Penicillium malachiteum]KAJ5726575.1 hypothetical protein N7483_007932 [Penicillium malachiteum]
MSFHILISPDGIPPYLPNQGDAMQEFESDSMFGDYQEAAVGDLSSKSHHPFQQTSHTNDAMEGDSSSEASHCFQPQRTSSQFEMPAFPSAHVESDFCQNSTTMENKETSNSLLMMGSKFDFMSSKFDSLLAKVDSFSAQVDDARKDFQTMQRSAAELLNWYHQAIEREKQALEKIHELISLARA